MKPKKTTQRPTNRVAAEAVADAAEVQVRTVTRAEVAWFDQQLADHHYLGAGQPVGEPQIRSAVALLPVPDGRQGNPGRFGEFLLCPLIAEFQPQPFQQFPEFVCHRWALVGTFRHNGILRHSTFYVK